MTLNLKVWFFSRLKSTPFQMNCAFWPDAVLIVTSNNNCSQDVNQMLCSLRLWDGSRTAKKTFSGCYWVNQNFTKKIYFSFSLSQTTKSLVFINIYSFILACNSKMLTFCEHFGAISFLFLHSFDLKFLGTSNMNFSLCTFVNLILCKTYSFLKALVGIFRLKLTIGS